MSPHISIDRETLAEFCRKHDINASPSSALRFGTIFVPTAMSMCWWSFSRVTCRGWTSSRSSANCLAFCKGGVWTWSRRSS